jgi:HK97 family phage portal protein
VPRCRDERAALDTGAYPLSVGLLDAFRFLAPPDPSPPSTGQEVSRTETLAATTEALYALIAEREGAFTMAEARKLDAVIRAKSLLTSIAASYLPLAYRDGMAMEEQPRIVSKPDPFATRYDFVAATVDSLIDDGCAFWRLVGGGDGNRPTGAYVIPHDEVLITNPSRGLVPVYEWRGQRLMLDVDIKHITIGRKAGELHGRGPLREGLTALATVKAAEDYARGWFNGGGIPPVVMQYLIGSLSAQEAAAAKAKWVEARATNAEPVVLGKDWGLTFPSTDPQRSQMQEARSYGATVTARLLGIPAALLHVETSGATITYTNPAGALEELTKSTIVPVYLSPIEAHWSELVPGRTSVRFDLNDMQRADLAARAAIYQAFVTMGAMAPAEVRAAEGWAPVTMDTAHGFDETPTDDPATAQTAAASVVEVPA